MALPLVLPPTVLGFYALIALGPRGDWEESWQAIFGHPLAFTFTGLVLASMLYSLPFAVQPLVASFESLDRRLLDASSMLGAGTCAHHFSASFCRWRGPGVITAVVLSFAHTLGRVRRRADGRRKSCWNHAHDIDRYLRSRASAGLCRARTRPRCFSW